MVKDRIFKILEGVLPGYRRLRRRIEADMSATYGDELRRLREQADSAEQARQALLSANANLEHLISTAEEDIIESMDFVRRSEGRVDSESLLAALPYLQEVPKSALDIIKKMESAGRKVSYMRIFFEEFSRLKEEYGIDNIRLFDTIAQCDFNLDEIRAVSWYISNKDDRQTRIDLADRVIQTGSCSFTAKALVEYNKRQAHSDFVADLSRCERSVLKTKAEIYDSWEDYIEALDSQVEESLIGPLKQKTLAVKLQQYEARHQISLAEYL